MAEVGGLVTSFLDSFTRVSELERERKRDRQMAVQQAVDNALRRHQQEIEDKRLQQTQDFQKRELDLREKGQESTDADRKARHLLNVQKLNELVKSRGQRVMSGVLTRRDARQKFLEQGGIEGTQAERTATEEAVREAEALGVEQPDQAVKGTGKITLGADTELKGVLPLTQAKMSAYKIGNALKVAQTKEVEDRTKMLEDSMASKAASAALDVTYKQNRNRIEAAKAASIETDIKLSQAMKKLGIEKNLLEIKGLKEKQPLDIALKRLQIAKDQKDLKTATEGSAALRQWIGKRIDLAEKEKSNANTHLPSLKKDQTKDIERAKFMQQKITSAAADNKQPDDADLKAFALLTHTIAERKQKIDEYESHSKTADDEISVLRGKMNDLTNLHIDQKPVNTSGGFKTGPAALSRSQIVDLEKSQARNQAKLGGKVKRKHITLDDFLKQP